MERRFTFLIADFTIQLGGITNWLISPNVHSAFNKSIVKHFK
jgi:hypothetical protein